MDDQRLRNGVGRAFAFECGMRELWTDDGPSPSLRTKVEARALPAEGLGAVQQPLNVRTRIVLHVPSQLALLKAQRADGLSVGMRSGKLHRG